MAPSRSAGARGAAEFFDLTARALAGRKMRTVEMEKISARAAVLTLANPEKLNSLAPEMVSEMRRHLEHIDAAAITHVEQGKDTVDARTFHCVVVRGAPRPNGKPAFCAGGDVVGLLKSTPEEAMAFFRDEYSLDHRTSTVNVPYLSLWDGPVMGGGVGLSVHGAYRVATERCLFAMPECAIGIFPDVGGTHVLSRLPEALGTYLALTGGKLTGREAYEVGLATHFIHSSQIGSLINRIVLTADVAKGRSTARAGVEQVLAEFTVAAIDAQSAKPTFLSALQSGGYLSRCFGSISTVEECLDNLKTETARVDTEYAAVMASDAVVREGPESNGENAALGASDVATTATGRIVQTQEQKRARMAELTQVREWLAASEASMASANPLSLKLALALLEFGRGAPGEVPPNLAACLQKEAVVMWHFLKSLQDEDKSKRGDFAAGVTHKLIEKHPSNVAPPWQYRSLADVPDDLVDAIMKAEPDGMTTVNFHEEEGNTGNSRL